MWSTSSPEADAPPSAARLSQSGGAGRNISLAATEQVEDYATTLKRKSTIRRQASEKVEGRPLSRTGSKNKSGGGAGGDASGGGGKEGSTEDVRIPMCGLVIGGDRFTLRQVYCSIIQNQCPMVVAKVNIFSSIVTNQSIY